MHNCAPLPSLRMLTETEEGVTLDVNHPGTYNTVCVELDMASLAVNTLIQVHVYHTVYTFLE